MDSFHSRSTMKVGGKNYEIYRLDALDKQGISTKHLPFSLRILLENLLRTEDGRNVKAEDIRALASWNGKTKSEQEIAFTPSRVLMQDFTGVPAVVDLAAMRDAMKMLGGDPASIFMASRIAARSTTAGTPVKSCISTRLGVNAISLSDFVLPLHDAKARMSSAFTLRPSSVRSRFSSRMRSENGRCLVEMPCRSRASRRAISYSRPPTRRME